MSNAFLALIVAVGVGAWIFSKMMRRSGGITQNALIVAGVAGAFVFIIVWMLANAFL